MQESEKQTLTTNYSIEKENQTFSEHKRNFTNQPQEVFNQALKTQPEHHTLHVIFHLLPEQ